jgi:hypothetical protein
MDPQSYFWDEAMNERVEPHVVCIWLRGHEAMRRAMAAVFENMVMVFSAQVQRDSYISASMAYFSPCVSPFDVLVLFCYLASSWMKTAEPVDYVKDGVRSLRVDYVYLRPSWYHPDYPQYAASAYRETLPNYHSHLLLGNHAGPDREDECLDRRCAPRNT